MRYSGNRADPAAGVLRTRHLVCLFRALLFLTAAIPFATPRAAAQTGTPLHLEMATPGIISDITHIPCDTAGLALFFLTSGEQGNILHLNHYNINLATLFTTTLRIDFTLTPIGGTYEDGRIYMLFQDKVKKKKSDTGLLIVYHCRTHTLDTLPVTHLPTESIDRLKAYRGRLYFVGDTGKDMDNLFFLDTRHPIAVPLQIADAPQYVIEDYLIDSVRSEVVVCLNTSSRSRNNVLWLCHTDLGGRVRHLIDFPDTLDYRFQNARIAILGRERFFIAGTYQNRKITLSNTASGIYACIYHDDRFERVWQRPYPDEALPNNTYGKSELLYIPSRIFCDSAHIAFATESFYPEYRYTTTYDYGVPTTQAIFSGYRFLNATILFFDTTGTNTNERTLPFESGLVSNITPHIRVAFPDGNTLIYYHIENNIYTMLLDKEMEIIDPLRTSTFFTEKKSTQAMRYTTGLNHWYGPYYFLSGYRFATQGSKAEKTPLFFGYKIRYQ